MKGAQAAELELACGASTATDPASSRLPQDTHREYPAGGRLGGSMSINIEAKSGADHMQGMVRPQPHFVEWAAA